MIQIEYLPIVLTGIGIIVSILYYTSVLRNQNETRQAQLFMEIYRDFKNQEIQKAYFDILKWEWDDYDDFNKKYLDWNEFQKVSKLIGIYEGLGVLVYRNLIDIRMIEELMRSYIINFWEKLAPIIEGQRETYPLVAEWTEYLYNEILKIESKPAYLLYK